jgi:hypothetical protein
MMTLGLLTIAVDVTIILVSLLAYMSLVALLLALLLLIEGILALVSNMGIVLVSGFVYFFFRTIALSIGPVSPTWS